MNNPLNASVLAQSDAAPITSLSGKRGIILGVANEASIAWGCARAMHAAGAQLALSYLNPKALPHVEPLAKTIGAPILVPCDVEKPGELETLFDAAARLWGSIDFFVHSIAYVPKDDLLGRLVARLPIVLTSRADSAAVRVASCAMAPLFAGQRGVPA